MLGAGHASRYSGTGSARHRSGRSRSCLHGPTGGDVAVARGGNDKQQIEPVLEQLGQLSDELGKAGTLLAGGGYFSEANVEACAEARIAPLIAPGRERHHLSWEQRFVPSPPRPHNPTAPEAMLHRPATPEGRKAYALRKQTPEPVFAIVKSVMGFRQFNLRGLDKAKGERNPVTLAWNMKRRFALQPARPDDRTLWPRQITPIPANLSV